MDNETIRNLEYAISKKRPDGRTLLVWGTYSAQGDFWRQIVPDRVKTADIPMQMKEYLSGCSIRFDMYEGKVIRLPYMDVCCSVTDECSIEDVLKALVNSVTSKEKWANWLPSANYYAGNLNGETRVPERSDLLPKRGAFIAYVQSVSDLNRLLKANDEEIVVGFVDASRAGFRTLTKHRSDTWEACAYFDENREYDYKEVRAVLRGSVNWMKDNMNRSTRTPYARNAVRAYAMERDKEFLRKRGYDVI